MVQQRAGSSWTYKILWYLVQLTYGHLTQLILTMNSFCFNGTYYLQIHGTAMGTRMAPSFANLFMGKLECEFLLTQNIKPQECWRFIEDIFAIWCHGEQLLCNFIESLNCPVRDN